ncbi:Signal transduction histidine kinase [Allokutzneria albata]|uniref:Signal transduction histidine kinase n=2 Tax=Allokutzneria albata TaxID=211114 RepID=A0A1G9ZVA7_ALLAB|nr:Signal transduction histidine kinase [Allokutzneria albata]
MAGADSTASGRGITVSMSTAEDTLASTMAPLWRGAVLFRVGTFVFATVGLLLHQSEYQRQWLGWLILGVMAGWTVFTSYAYSRESGHRTRIVAVDVLLTLVLIGLSALVLDRAYLETPRPTVTTVWGASCVVAAAVQAGQVGGLLAGGANALVSFFVRGYFTFDIARDTMLLIAVGFVIGMASTTARRSAMQLDQALRAQAATAERERLARSIHDGVLQVLSRVRRRGSEVGGEAAELAKLAGEQEVALRSLVAAAPPDSSVDGEVDLGPQLQVLATPRVQVSVPATPVRVPTSTAAELVAIAREALTNADKHAGPDARAWVLLEDLGEDVVLSVRDNGPGIPEGRLAEAEAEGRMGVSRSIRGRVADLGGSLALLTAPGDGVEWEIKVRRGGTE